MGNLSQSEIDALSLTSANAGYIVFNTTTASTQTWSGSAWTTASGGTVYNFANTGSVYSNLLLSADGLASFGSTLACAPVVANATITKISIMLGELNTSSTTSIVVQVRKIANASLPLASSPISSSGTLVGTGTLSIPSTSSVSKNVYAGTATLTNASTIADGDVLFVVVSTGPAGTFTGIYVSAVAQ